MSLLTKEEEAERAALRAELESSSLLTEEEELERRQLMAELGQDQPAPTKELSLLDPARPGVSAAVGFGQGLARNLGDEAWGVVGAGFNALTRSSQGIMEDYRRLRDEAREYVARAEEANPKTYLTGNVAGGMIGTIGKGLPGLAADAALAGYGASSGSTTEQVIGTLAPVVGVGVLGNAGKVLRPVAEYAGKLLPGTGGRTKVGALLDDAVEAIQGAGKEAVPKGGKETVGVLKAGALSRALEGASSDVLKATEESKAIIREAAKRPGLQGKAFDAQTKIWEAEARLAKRLTSPQLQDSFKKSAADKSVPKAQKVAGKAASDATADSNYLSMISAASLGPVALLAMPITNPTTYVKLVDGVSKAWAKSLKKAQELGGNAGFQAVHRSLLKQPDYAKFFESLVNKEGEQDAAITTKATRK